MGRGFDKTPLIVQRTGKSTLRVVRDGEAEIVLRSTPNDPLGEIPIVRVLGAGYNEGFHTAHVPQKRFDIENAQSFENLWYGFAYDTVSRLYKTEA